MEQALFVGGRDLSSVADPDPSSSRQGTPGAVEARAALRDRRFRFAAAFPSMPLGLLARTGERGA
jgi:hypothetical protein